LIISDKELFNYLEVLVVNDGSKDSSSAIAHEYESKYPNVYRVIDKENGNYGSCVNKGLEIATGKYFRILDADDWFETIQMQKFLSMLQITDTDVVITNYTRWFGEDNQLQIKIDVEYNTEFLIDGYDFSSRDYCSMLLMHAMTFKTDLLRRIRYTQQTGISYTDIEYCYFPFSRAKQMVFLDIYLYVYWLGRDGQTMQRENVIKNVSHFYKVTNRIIKDYIDNQKAYKLRQLPLIYIISNPLYQIYAISLLYQSNPTPQQYELLCKTDEMVMCNKSLYQYVNSYSFKKIPFVWLWHTFGLKIGRLTSKIV
jgi:glycosyltransferase involved in cell wall biosynthesis